MRVRTAAVALVALLALAGVAAAQPGPGGSDGPGGSGSSGSSGSASSNPQEERRFRECLERAEDGPQERKCIEDHCSRNPRSDFCMRHCREHPEREFCPRPGATGPGNQGPGGRGPGAGQRHITFALADGDRGVVDLAVHGRPVLTSVLIDGHGPFEASRHGGRLEVRGPDVRLQVHDDASGFVRFEGNGTAVLTFPEGIRHDDRVRGGNITGARITYEGGGRALLDARTLEWQDNRTAVVHHFFSFHIVPAQGQPTAPGPADPVVRGKIKDAVERGDRVGAELRIHAGAGEVFAYDRVDVRLQAPQGRPTDDDPVRVVLSAHLGEGRTFVLHLNRSLLDVAEDEVRLRYFDLPDGENGTARTEVLFRRAANLDDILDPTDDGGQPEYWIVRDANGMQVLVSVPHWSVHMVELSALSQVVQPSVLIGVLAGAGVTVLAAVALFAPRRRV